MTIPFASVPSNLRIPFVAVEFDASLAQQGPALLSYRSLLIGQRLAGGTAPANSLRKVSNEDQVATYAGRGSMLHRQAKSYFRNNRFTETWIGLLDDNVAGVAATGTLTITGPATAAGTLAVYIGGEPIQVRVASGAVQNDIATAVAAAITANPDLPVTAEAATNVVTITHRHKGAAGNDVDLRVNYHDGEALPAGLTVAVVAMANGTTSPVLTTLIAALGDSWFHVIAHPYTDATSLTAIEAELADRLGATRMIDGVAFTSAAGTQAAIAALAHDRNSPSSCIIAQPGKNPLTPPVEFAAGVAGVVAFFGAQDPARPLQTLPVSGALAPAEGDRFTNAERNLSLFEGVGTTVARSDGTVALERLITTYRENAAGSSDASYLDVTTMLNLMYLRFSFRARWATRYPRHKLADDGTRFGAGQPVITPMLARAEAVAWFRDMEELGLVEGMAQFKANLQVERNPTDRNRLDFLLPPDVVNQLIVSAANIQFRL